MNEYKIALYIRLSIDDRQSDSLSIGNQQKQLQSYVTTMQEHKNYNLKVLEFIDNGFSGTNFERPKVQELLELVQQNKVDCIIVKDFSRFGRDSIETGYFIEKVFPTFKVRFISISDNFDSNNFKEDTGGIDVAFKYLVNEYYSRDLSMKVKSSIHNKMKNGEYRLPGCVYGYKKGEGSYFEIDNNVADVVRLIFKLKCDKLSNKEIAKVLNDDKIPTPGEYKKSVGDFGGGFTEGRCFWTIDKVRKILNNEMYIGTYIVNKYSVKKIGDRAKENTKDEWVKIPNHNPKIIDDEVFAVAQSNMKKLTPKKEIREGPKYLLKSKIACGVCRHNLYRRNKNPIFVCVYDLEQDNIYCKNIRVFEEDIENIIFTMIKKQAKIILDTDIDFNNDCIDFIKISEYEKEIAYIEDKKISLYERYLRKELNLIDYKTQKVDCDEKLLELKNIYDMQKSKASKFDEILNTNEKMTTIALEVVNHDKLTEKLVDLLVDKVFVFPDNKIEIRWKVEDFIKIK